MSSENSSSSSSTRWWEFYFVRYGMGTVFGAMIVFFLFSKNPYLKDALLLPPDHKFEAFHITLYAAYGLAYCYISSAPILVMHAGRFLFQNQDSSGSPSIYSGSIYVLLGTLLLFIAFFVERDVSLNMLILRFMVLYFLVFAVGFQTYIVHHLGKKSSRLYSSYLELARIRCSSKSIDITESYRHLREHGNSFLILFFELIFGAVLYLLSATFSDNLFVITRLFLITIAWIIPAALIWYIGTKIELEFVRHKPVDTGSPPAAGAP